MSGPNLGIDPVPGNIGLLPDEDTVILLPFTEPNAVHPSDTAGALEDLEAANPGEYPATDTSVAWASGVTRLFPGDKAFITTDKDGGSSLLTRDVSVQVLIAF